MIQRTIYFLNQKFWKLVNFQSAKVSSSDLGKNPMIQGLDSKLFN